MWFVQTSKPFCCGGVRRAYLLNADSMTYPTLEKLMLYKLQFTGRIRIAFFRRRCLFQNQSISANGTAKQHGISSQKWMKIKDTSKI